MKTLIIGGTGYLGSMLVNTLKNTEITGTGYTKYSNQNTSFINTIFIDLKEKFSIERAIKSVSPDIVVHCGGMTKSDQCENNKNLAFETNVIGTKNLVDTFDGKIIYFSTDYVFDGKNPPYYEDSAPNPINVYGNTKLLAEMLVLKNKNNLVIRTSGLYGLNPHNNRLVELLRNKELDAPVNLLSTPTYVNDIVLNWDNILNERGVLHFSGEETISRYDFLQKVNNILRMDAKITPVTYDESILRVAKPLNSSLKSHNPKKTNTIDEALNLMKGELYA